MYQYKAKVLKVLDGDTVDIDLDLGFNIILANQRVRMAGIDTPESLLLEDFVNCIDSAKDEPK